MEIFIRATSVTDAKMVKASPTIELAVSMTVNGFTIRCMEMALSPSKMAQNMWDNSKKTSAKAEERRLGLMEESSRVNL